MSQLNVGTIQTTTITPTNGVSVNFGGSAVPTYAGSPMVSQGNLPTTPVGDAGGYFANDNLGAQLQEIAAAFQTLTPGTTGSMAAIIKQFYRIANPVGKVVTGYWNTAPAGTLFLNGVLVSRTAFPELWAYVNSNSLALSEASWAAAGGQTFFSVGNGVDTFRLPDLRGEFIRAWDNGRGIDSGRTLGSWQADALQNIQGWFGCDDRVAGDLGAIGGASNPFYNNTSLHGGGDTTAQGGDGARYEVGFDASRNVRTASETRPRSVSLAAAIYY